MVDMYKVLKNEATIIKSQSFYHHCNLILNELDLDSIWNSRQLFCLVHLKILILLTTFANLTFGYLLVMIHDLLRREIMSYLLLKLVGCSFSDCIRTSILKWIRLLHLQKCIEALVRSIWSLLKHMKTNIEPLGWISCLWILEFIG